MANLLYVDNSNVWIEGMHVAAVESGMAPDIWSAQTNKICDASWKLDFGRLFHFAGGEREDVKRAVLFGSRPPPNDSLWIEQLLFCKSCLSDSLGVRVQGFMVR